MERQCIQASKAAHLQLVHKGFIGGAWEAALRVQHCQHTQAPAHIHPVVSNSNRSSFMCST